MASSLLYSTLRLEVKGFRAVVVSSAVSAGVWVEYERTGVQASKSVDAYV